MTTRNELSSVYNNTHCENTDNYMSYTNKRLLKDAPMVPHMGTINIDDIRLVPDAPQRRLIRAEKSETCLHQTNSATLCYQSSSDAFPHMKNVDSYAVNILGSLKGMETKSSAQENHPATVSGTEGLNVPISAQRAQCDNVLTIDKGGTGQEANHKTEMYSA